MANNFFSDSIKNYLLELSGIKRVSENTLIAYKKDLDHFREFLDNRNISSTDKVSDKLIRQYIVILNEENLDRATIARKLSSLRGYFNFLERNQKIKKNPVLSIKNPKLKRKLPEIITLDSYEKILKLLDEESKDNKGKKLIFELLYGCALRVSEVCNLNFGDIDLNRKCIRVLGKGSKTRIVPFGEKSISIYEDYRSNLGHIQHNAPLILTPRGKRIYPRYVGRLVEKYLSKVSDISKKSPHVLRHTAATHMLDKGADLLGVKEILGHENLSTTQIYTHVSIERLKKAHKKAHPKS